MLGTGNQNLDQVALAGVAPSAEVSSYKLKGCGFDFQSGHVPELRIRPPVREHLRGN